MSFNYSPPPKYESEMTTVNSPFIMTREYQQHVDALESENFTLRMLLDNLQARLEYFIKTQNAPDGIQRSDAPGQHNLNDYINFNNQLELALKEEEKHDEDHPEATLEVSTLNAQIETLQSKVNELEASNKDLQSANFDLENKIKELEDNNEENEKAIQQLQFENDEFQEINQNNQNQLEDLQKQLQDALDELDQEKENSKAKDMRIADLEKREPSIDFSSIEETVKNYDNVLRENDDLKKENAELQSRNDELNDDNNKLNDQINNLKQKILDLENEHESILAAFDVSDSADLITKYETLDQINNELQEQIDEIGQENEKLRNELDEIYEKMKSQPHKSPRDDTFDVTPISRINSTFTIDEGDKFSLDNNIISPKRSTTLSAQKKIDQLTAENQKLKENLEELKLQLQKLMQPKSSVQTSPFKGNNSTQTKMTKGTSPFKGEISTQTKITKGTSPFTDDTFGQNKATISTSPIKNQNLLPKRIAQPTSPIKPNFHLSQPVSANYQNESSGPQSPKRSFINDLQNKINELTKQNKELEAENLELQEQLHNQSDDPLASETGSQLSKNSKNSKLSQISGINNNSSIRNSTLNSMSASSILSPNEQKLKVENEKLRQSLEEVKNSQLDSPQGRREIDRLNREIELLKKENEELKRDDKNSNALRLKMELISAKQRIAQLEASLKQIKINVQKQMNQFLTKMTNFTQIVDNKIDSQMKSIKNLQELIPRILMDKSHFPLTNLRKDVVAFIDETSDMMRDLRDGATACIRATAGLLRKSNKKSLQIPLSGGEKNQILNLKRKYNLDASSFLNDSENNAKQNSPKFSSNSPKSPATSPSYSTRNSSSRRLINTISGSGSGSERNNNIFNNSDNNSNKSKKSNSSRNSNNNDNGVGLSYKRNIIDRNDNNNNNNNDSSFRNAIDNYYNTGKTQNEKNVINIRSSSNNYSDSNQSPDSSMQKKYSFLINQFQLLINALWELFGESNMKAPSVLELIKSISQFKEFIQRFIQTIKKKYEIVKKYDDGTIEALSPIVVNLIQTVRDQVSIASQRLHNEHNDLLQKIETEIARTYYTNINTNVNNLSSS